MFDGLKARLCFTSATLMVFTLILLADTFSSFFTKLLNNDAGSLLNRSVGTGCSLLSVIIFITTLNGRVKKVVGAGPGSHANKLRRFDHKVPGRAAQILLRPVHSAIR
jgi:hypothetical protein